MAKTYKLQSKLVWFDVTWHTKYNYFLATYWVDKNMYSASQAKTSDLAQTSKQSCIKTLWDSLDVEVHWGWAGEVRGHWTIAFQKKKEKPSDFVMFGLLHASVCIPPGLPPPAQRKLKYISMWPDGFFVAVCAHHCSCIGALFQGFLTIGIQTPERSQNIVFGGMRWYKQSMVKLCEITTWKRDVLSHVLSSCLC